MGVDHEQVYAMSLLSSLWAHKHQCNGINLVINNRVKTKLNIAHAYFMYCLAPRRLSLNENLHAKEGWKEKMDKTLPLIFLLSIVPCASSPVTHMSLAFYTCPCVKNKAPQEEALVDTNLFGSFSFLLIKIKNNSRLF